MFKIFLNLFDHQIVDYDNLLKMNKIKEITLKQFINFLEFYAADQNIFFEILSRWMIIVKKKFLKKFRIDQKERNIIVMNQVINNSFEEIYNSLFFKDPLSYLDKFI